MTFRGLYRTRNGQIVDLDCEPAMWNERGDHFFERELDLVERIPPGDEPLVKAEPKQ